jgi:hypothetical protein
MQCFVHLLGTAFTEHFLYEVLPSFFENISGRRCRDRMVVGFTTTFAINAYHHWSEFESHSGMVYSIQHYVIKFISDLRQFSPSTLISSTNKTDRHEITEILLIVALNTITLTPWKFTLVNNFTFFNKIRFFKKKRADLQCT